MRRGALILVATLALLSCLGAGAFGATLLGTEGGDRLPGTGEPDQVYSRAP